MNSRLSDQIGFLKSHFYHTDYAAEHRSPRKLKNLADLEKKQKKKVERAINNVVSVTVYS